MVAATVQESESVIDTVHCGNGGFSTRIKNRDEALKRRCFFPLTFDGSLRFVALTTEFYFTIVPPESDPLETGVHSLPFGSGAAVFYRKIGRVLQGLTPKQLTYHPDFGY